MPRDNFINPLKYGGIPRTEIRRVLSRIYNQNSTLTIKPIAMEAYLDQW